MKTTVEFMEFGRGQGEASQATQYTKKNQRKQKSTEEGNVQQKGKKKKKKPLD